MADGRLKVDICNAIDKKDMVDFGMCLPLMFMSKKGLNNTKIHDAIYQVVILFALTKKKTTDFLKLILMVSI